MKKHFLFFVILFAVILNFSNTSAQPGNCLDFDGTDDHILVADDNSLDLNTFTIFLWVKADVSNAFSTCYRVSRTWNTPWWTEQLSRFIATVRAQNPSHRCKQRLPGGGTLASNHEEPGSAGKLLSAR